MIKMTCLDNCARDEMEKELEEELKGTKPVEKRKRLTQCADYLLSEDKFPLEAIEKKGYSP